MAQGASAVDNRAVVGTGGEEAGVTHSGGGIDRNLVTSEGWGEGGDQAVGERPRIPWPWLQDAIPSFFFFFPSCPIYYSVSKFSSLIFCSTVGH